MTPLEPDGPTRIETVDAPGDAHHQALMVVHRYNRLELDLRLELVNYNCPRCRAQEKAIPVCDGCERTGKATRWLLGRIRAAHLPVLPLEDLRAFVAAQEVNPIRPSPETPS